MKHASLYDRLQRLAAKAFSKLPRFGRSRGEERMASLVGPYSSARFGPRNWDKFVQVRNYTSWVSRCVEFITLGTRQPPDIVRVTGDGEREQYTKALRQWRAKGYAGDGPVRRKFLSDVRRKSTVGPVKATEDYEYLPNDHPAVRLVNDPNEPYTGLKFWQLLGTYEELTGESFTWVVPNGAGRPVELWVLPSQWVTPRNDGTTGRLVDFFEVRGVNGPVEVFDPDEIIWTKNDNPWHPLYATSRVQTCSAVIDAYQMTEFARYAAMENGVGSGGVVTMPPDLNPPQDLIDRLEARFLAKNAGPANAGRPLILNGGLEWTPPNDKMELAFKESEDQLRKYILAHFGLDEAMMGFANDATYAGAVVTDRSLFKRVYGPRLEDRAATLTERLLPKFGTDLRAVYTHSAASEDPDQKRQDWNIAVGARAVTVNEIRTELLGLEPSDDPAADELPQDPMDALGGDMAGWDAEGTGAERPGFQSGAGFGENKSLNRLADLNGHTLDEALKHLARLQ